LKRLIPLTRTLFFIVVLVILFTVILGLDLVTTSSAIAKNDSYLPVTSSSSTPSSGVYVPKLFDFQVPLTIITPNVPALEEGPVNHSNITKLLPATFESIEGKNIPDQYIIVLKPKLSVAQLEKESNVVKEKGVQILDTYEQAFKGFVVRIANNQQALDMLQRDPEILAVERDQTVHTFGEGELPEIGRGIQSSQIMPTGINRVDADLSSQAVGNLMLILQEYHIYRLPYFLEM
jgi:Peptidase inhibitor I9